MLMEVEVKRQHIPQIKEMEIIKAIQSQLYHQLKKNNQVMAKLVT